MAIEHTLESPLARAVRAAKGQSAFGRIIGRSQSYVHGLMRDGKPLPAEEVLLAEAATGISRSELRPDLFGHVAKDAHARAATDVEAAR